MSAIGRLVRTTAFKLTLVYLAVFAALAVALITYIATTTQELIDSQFNSAIEAEIRALAEQYQTGGLQRLIRAVERRSVRPDASVYLITDFAGNRVAGNIASLSAGAALEPNGETIPVLYQRLTPTMEAADDEELRRAVARVFVLKGNFQLLVGRDVEERIEFAQIIRQSMRAAIAVIVILALLSWMFVSRSVLKKIDAIAESGRSFVAGNLSGRLPTDGTGDEFDRLAASLNVMLGRIEQLHEGLREVSDNIAHDLKTPLTRVRNRIDEALRLGHSDEATRELLGAAVEESEELIRTFDALLMIARVESGSTENRFDETDLAALVRDLAEFYEPVAEEAGLRVQVDAPERAVISVHRELVRLLVANLIDNAIKYGGAECAARTGRQPTIRVAARPVGDGVEVIVEDNGPGIPAADRERVTNRFVRLEKSRTKPGAGLGLSLVKAVARYHGADLSLEDVAPGLRVRVLFRPREPEQAEA